MFLLVPYFWDICVKVVLHETVHAQTLGLKKMVLCLISWLDTEGVQTSRYPWVNSGRDPSTLFIWEHCHILPNANTSPREVLAQVTLSWLPVQNEVSGNKLGIPRLVFSLLQTKGELGECIARWEVSLLALYLLLLPFLCNPSPLAIKHDNHSFITNVKTKHFLKIKWTNCNP